MHKLGRKIFKEREVTLRDIEKGEVIKRTVIFARMKKEDLNEMCKIHNRVWQSKLYDSLGLTNSQFQSQFSSFPGIGTYLIDTHRNGEVRTIIPIGGISPLRINAKITMIGKAPEKWKLSEEDDLPTTWNSCTNFGTYDHSSSAGNGGRVWPNKKGNAIVCPTVYSRKMIRLGRKKYKIMSSIMGDLVFSVAMLAEEISKAEQMDIQMAAYSTPKSFARYLKEYSSGIPIDTYLTATKPQTEFTTYAEYCKDNENPVEESLFEFMKMPLGIEAFRKYVRTFGLTDIETFMKETNRNLVDFVIGNHIKCGARIGKIFPNGRIDPTAKNYNIWMSYPTIIFQNKNVEKEIKT